MTATLRGVRRLLGSPVVQALAAPHGVDRYLELVNPRWSLRDIRAEITDVRRGTADSVTLGLAPNGNWRGFRAGQYARFGVEIGGVRRTRCFSIASSQHRRDRRIEITVKATAEGTVSRHLRDHARPGTVLAMSQAEGEFVLPEQRPQRLLMISGGSGVTPLMSMLRTLCDEGHRGPITFLHYARAEHDLIYRDELVALAAAHPNVRLLRAYTRPDHVGELSGRFRREHLLAAAPDRADRADGADRVHRADGADPHTYLCGPEPLMDAVREHYEVEGMADRLHAERFTLARYAPSAGDATGRVHFAEAGTSVDNSGATLLEQAERAGLRPLYGCRMGVCMTCSRRVEAGTLRDLRTGAVHPVEDAEAQLCVSVPVGDVTVAL